MGPRNPHTAGNLNIYKKIFPTKSVIRYYSEFLIDFRNYNNNAAE